MVENLVEKYDSPRKTWKIINERINNVKTRNITPYIATNEGVKITEKRVITEAFAN